MENQVTRSLSTKLSEEEAEKYIDLVHFFSEQAFNLYNASKTCNPVKLSSIELSNGT